MKESKKLCIFANAVVITYGKKQKKWQPSRNVFGVAESLCMTPKADTVKFGSNSSTKDLDSLENLPKKLQKRLFKKPIATVVWGENYIQIGEEDVIPMSYSTKNERRFISCLIYDFINQTIIIKDNTSKEVYKKVLNVNNFSI